jgi:hypothetical protein
MSKGKNREITREAFDAHVSMRARKLADDILTGGFKHIEPHLRLIASEMLDTSIKYKK